MTKKSVTGEGRFCLFPKDHAMELEIGHFKRVLTEGCNYVDRFQGLC